ncbi:MAG: 5'-3' exonuclease H3TH domain-containing protein [Patescibacteria group bacterium]
MDRLLLIDTANYIHRAYHALPKSFKSESGKPTNAIYGFTSMLISTLGALKPTHVIAAIDDDQPTFRDKLFAPYKKNRKEMDADLSVQFAPIMQIIDCFGIKKANVTGFEADDMIGTLAHKADALGFDVVLVSNDRDVQQLLSPHIKVFYPDASSKEGGSFFGASEFKQKYGFDPLQIIEFKALRGDSSDNLPGVLGIGEKTATELIKKYGTIENLYKNIDELKPESLKRKLLQDKEMAFLCKKLATIALDAPVEFLPTECKIRAIDKLEVAKELKKYNFKSLIGRLGFELKEDGSVEIKSDKKLLEKDDSQLSLL